MEDRSAYAYAPGEVGESLGALDCPIIHRIAVATDTTNTVVCTLLEVTKRDLLLIASKSSGPEARVLIRCRPMKSCRERCSQPLSSESKPITISQSSHDSVASHVDPVRPLCFEIIELGGGQVEHRTAMVSQLQSYQ